MRGISSSFQKNLIVVLFTYILRSGTSLGPPTRLADIKSDAHRDLHPCMCAVSRSEAGQQKQLLILDEHFQEVEALDLDVGPRHYALAHAAATPDSLPASLRRGDKCGHLIGIACSKSLRKQ